MTRVSEQSSFHAINHAVNKTKSKLEDLQIKGSNLKENSKPLGRSDRKHRASRNQVSRRRQ